MDTSVECRSESDFFSFIFASALSVQREGERDRYVLNYAASNVHIVFAAGDMLALTPADTKLSSVVTVEVVRGSLDVLVLPPIAATSVSNDRHVFVDRLSARDAYRSHDPRTSSKYTLSAATDGNMMHLRARRRSEVRLSVAETVPKSDDQLLSRFAGGAMVVESEAKGAVLVPSEGRDSGDLVVLLDGSAALTGREEHIVTVTKPSTGAILLNGLSALHRNHVVEVDQRWVAASDCAVCRIDRCPACVGLISISKKCMRACRVKAVETGLALSPLVWDSARTAFEGTRDVRPQANDFPYCPAVSQLS